MDDEDEIFYCKFNRFPGTDIAAYGGAKKTTAVYRTHGQFVRVLCIKCDRSTKNQIPGLARRTRHRNHPPPKLDYLKSTPDHPLETIINNLCFNFPNLTTAKLEFHSIFPEVKLLPILYNLLTACISLKRLTFSVHLAHDTEYPTLETLLSTLNPSPEYATLESLNLDLRLKPQRTSRSRKPQPPPAILPDIPFLTLFSEVVPRKTFEDIKDFSFHVFEYHPWPVTTFAANTSQRFLHLPNVRKLTINATAPTRKILELYCKVPRDDITDLTTLGTSGAPEEELITFLFTFPNIHSLTLLHVDFHNRGDPPRDWQFLNRLQPPHLHRLKLLNGYTKSPINQMERMVGAEFWQSWKVKYTKEMYSMGRGPLWKFYISF
ncbi:hypothetical protein TWF694_006485 [Orbilia ellipsospora]|uniref:F-box domain-containing protein n=1 Tax=Orbilia ellipsospora TaxID=2528407 RepID=A0AAV9XL67_9PEZI